jgi:hypothetical protein
MSQQYFTIPFEDKEKAKLLGARWDAGKKTWYAPTFEVGMKMLSCGWKEIENIDDVMRYYLVVPFADKEEVKALGAKWDADKKKWYAPSGDVFEKTKRWTQSPVASTLSPSRGTPTSICSTPVRGRINADVDAELEIIDDYE